MTRVTTELSLMQRDGRRFDEEAMAAAAPGSIGDLASLDGAVTLIEGESRFDIGDTLLYAVSELCGTVVPGLVAEGRAVYAGFAHDEELTFIRTGDRLAITSTHRLGVTLPASETLASLVGAGRRLVVLFPRLLPEADAGHAVHAASLRDQVEAGAEALGL